MIAIGFDPVSGQIIISENGCYAPRSLVVGTAPLMPDHVQINDLAGRGVQTAAWSDVTSLDGTYAALNLADAMAYLQSEFAKYSPVGETFGAPVVAGANLRQGQPVAVSRASGQLLPARADTYTLSFCAGLASADTVQGFTNQPAHGAVTLPDWTAVTGVIALTVGQPYFLDVAGGLTSAPDRAAAACIARIGSAVSPTTLVVQPFDPIFL